MRFESALHPLAQIAVALILVIEIRAKPPARWFFCAPRVSNLDLRSGFPRLPNRMLRHLALQPGGAPRAQMGNKPGLGFSRFRETGEEDQVVVFFYIRIKYQIDLIDITRFLGRNWCLDSVGVPTFFPND